jgi:GNAT superfamily N-acetyltransferase
VVAVDDDRLIGWAEYGRNGEPAEADVAFCLVDAAQGHGLGPALLRAILSRATDAGLTRVYADIDPANRAARGAWRAVAAEFGGGPDASAARIRHRLDLPHPIFGELALTVGQALRPQG